MGSDDFVPIELAQINATSVEVQKTYSNTKIFFSYKLRDKKKNHFSQR